MKKVAASFVDVAVKKRVASFIDLAVKKLVASSIEPARPLLALGWTF